MSSGCASHVERCRGGFPKTGGALFGGLYEGSLINFVYPPYRALLRMSDVPSCRALSAGRMMSSCLRQMQHMSSATQAR